MFVCVAALLAWTGPFGQQVEWRHLPLIGLLVVLEGVLSIDNALVLGLLAKRLPKKQQPRALTYGLVGAFVFRVIAIATAAFLLRWWWVKLLGGGYLLYVALKHFFFESKEASEEEVTSGADGELQLRDADTHQPLTPEREVSEIRERTPFDPPDEVVRQSVHDTTSARKFWMTVLVIELTDIAFAIDSILAAMAMVGSPPPDNPPNAPHPQLWVVITGGILGVILMRFAAVIFIKLLEKFPRFETAAYLLVTVIGLKLLADWGFNSPTSHPLDFHSPRNPAFWVFWIAMAVSFAIGFIRKKPKAEASPPV
jgi:YkoY family integral membrane protein